MTSVYTELTKEAAKRGGPAALRTFYRGQGALIGFAVASVGVGGTSLYRKVRARGSSASAAPEPALDRENSSKAPAPGVESD